MVRRLIGFALALQATAACLLSASLDGLVGGGVDASSDSPDDGGLGEGRTDALDADATGDHASDAAPIGPDASDARWCASNTPEGGLCWDFDDGQLTEGWTSIEVSPPLGQLQLEDAGASSLPYALHASVTPTTEAGATVNAKLGHQLAVFPANVDVAFEARGSVVAGGDFVLLEIYCQPPGGYSHVELHLSQSSSVHVSSYGSALDGGGQSVPDLPIGILSASTWTRIAVHVEYTADPSGNLAWTFSGSFGGTPFMGSSIALDGLPTSSGRLLLGLRAGEQQGAMHYDNVTLLVH